MTRDVTKIRYYNIEWRIFPVYKGQKWPFGAVGKATKDGYSVAPVRVVDGEIEFGRVSHILGKKPKIYKTLAEAERQKQWFEKNNPVDAVYCVLDNMQVLRFPTGPTSPSEQLP